MNKSNLTYIALKNNQVVYLVMAVIIGLGLSAYFSLPQDSMPPYTVRNASVVTNYSGASPERIEQLITIPIEEVIQEIPEVKTITSTSRTGVSIISVSLYDFVKKEQLQPIWDKLRRKIEAIENGFPGEASSPDVQDDDIGVSYGIFVGLKNDGFAYNELEDYADHVRQEIIRLQDAAKVEIAGIINQRIYIDYNDEELANYGLSGQLLQNYIASTNIIIPAGEVALENERIILEPSGNLESVDQLKNLLITINGSSIPLNEIANVRRDYVTPRESIVKIDGKEAMAIYVSMKDGANITRLGAEIDKLIPQLNSKLPLGIEAIRIASQDYEVYKSVDSFVSNVIQSILIVLIVVILFLGYRAGFLVASIIPSVIIMSFLFMSYAGTGLNQVSLAGFIIALGLLVDNGIVVVESILERIEEGESKFNASVNTCKEFLVPLLISSLTTSAAFLSFYLAESVLGETMGNLFVVVSIALLSSWVIAFTLIPLLSQWILSDKKKEKEKSNTTVFAKITPYYSKLISYTLKKPLLALASVLILFLISLYGFTKIPFEFMPNSERNLITLELDLPLGTKIEVTESTIGKLESYITNNLQNDSKDSIGILDWSTYIGVGPNSFDQGYTPGEQNSSYAYMIINTTKYAANQPMIDALESYVKKNILDGSVTVTELVMGGGASVPVQVRLKGNDASVINKAAIEVKKKLLTIEGTKNISDDWGPRIKKFFVDINPVNLAEAGLTNQDVALSLNTLLSGMNVGDFREDDLTIPIVLRSRTVNEIKYRDLESINVYSQSTGNSVPLSQVADIDLKWQYPKIKRRDLALNLTIDCFIDSDITAKDVTDILKPWLDEKSEEWGNAVAFEFGGESESSGDAMGAVIVNLPISLFIMVILLMIQFNSLKKTFIILSTIPFVLIGLVAGLLLTNSFFSFTAFLAIISLAGIVINDAIVLIDKTRQQMEANPDEPIKALIDAAKSRLQPILLTTFTTSFGMIPLWIGGGVMWRPMAISIIFGLFFATVILLIYVPALYKIMYKLK
ncbi:efflux RND transporter permease subunit [Croceitalea sp. P059]|uniref:efflux RND transporter permease subunit n=1 Tax=Croceitalea sp. P059 TaxID=3075601 RepID=UPI00288590CF|nr:efflux RND transporter permease subunit [Croceitalea sp. P059]MDT0540707.1 efflux RND transporter permease subunit [Croceitalea sp. P059]